MREGFEIRQKCATEIWLYRKTTSHPHKLLLRVQTFTVVLFFHIERYVHQIGQLLILDCQMPAGAHSTI